MVTALHYIYDQHGGGRERFVYYCASCSCVLGVRRDLGPAGEAPLSPGGRCMGCGSELEGNVECRIAPVPDEWADVYLNPQKAPQKLAAEFRSASSIPHFSLGFPRLDSLLRPIAPGVTAVVSGAAAPAVAELAAFRAQLPLEMGGLDSNVLFIDGGNSSDPYLFSSFARQRGFRPTKAMRRVTTCRVFTMYQLATLVSEHLAPAVSDYAARLVVIADLLGTFNEPELDEREARRLLSAVGDAVGTVKKNAFVLVTLSSPNDYDSEVMAWADTAVSLTPSGGRVRAELLRHPSRPSVSSEFLFKQLLRPMKGAS